MTLKHVRHTLTFFAFLAMATGCKSGERPPDFEFIDLTDAGTGIGCSQPGFPDEQPDMSPFDPPRFVTDTGEEELLVRPGDPLMAEVTVNDATRRVLVELAFAWSPEVVVYTEEIETPGDRTIPMILFPPADNRGRFFMRVTLCGFNCNEQEVVFDLIDPDPDDPKTGINADYERTLIENGEVIQVDQTCITPNSILVQ